jgi:hypothetical protein
VKASGDTSIAIASATGGAGKEFFSDSEEKTQRQKEGCVRLATPGGREGEVKWPVRWRTGDEAAQ